MGSKATCAHEKELELESKPLQQFHTSGVLAGHFKGLGIESSLVVQGERGVGSSREQLLPL
jgi:hypothetical protein